MENKKFKIDFDGEVISLFLKEGAEIDLDALLEIRQVLHEISKNEDFPLIVFADIGTNSSDEVNDILAHEGKHDGNLIVAIIVKNLASRMNANHFKSISKTNKIVEVFTSEQEAREWIFKMKR